LKNSLPIWLWTGFELVFVHVLIFSNPKHNQIQTNPNPRQILQNIINPNKLKPKEIGRKFQQIKPSVYTQKKKMPSVYKKQAFFLYTKWLQFLNHFIF
jgi:hypothetical protein